MQLIELKDIYKTYHLGEIDVPVLKGVSVTLAVRELIALFGASGSGKCTLMDIVTCLVYTASGQYLRDGVDVSGLIADDRAIIRNRKIKFPLQHFKLLPPTTAPENV